MAFRKPSRKTAGGSLDESMLTTPNTPPSAKSWRKSFFSVRRRTSEGAELYGREIEDDAVSAVDSLAAYEGLSPQKEQEEVGARSTAMGIASLTARVLVNLGEATNLPYLKGIAGLAQLIIETTDRVNSNKEDCLRIATRVCELVEAIARLRHKTGHEWTPQLFCQIEQLQNTFIKILDVVRKLSQRKYLKRFVRQDDDMAMIVDCERDLRQAFDVFGLQTNIDVQNTVALMERKVGEQHNEILETLQLSQQVTLEAIRTDFQSFKDNLGERSPLSPISPTSTLSQYTNVPPSPLPASPKIFHGRDKELSTLLTTILKPDSDAARIAILGSGGIGKSSLALAVLHHPKIVKAFGRQRFFIPCDAANSVDGLLSAAASYFELSEYHRQGGRALLAEDVLARLTDPTTRALLVLDNFESPWEPLDGRADVEDFLGRIADLGSVVLLVTMRGAERPAGSRWTRPFLRPLQPLDACAARQTFLDISDIDVSDGDDDDGGENSSSAALDELLALSDHLPLALTLMASLAQAESAPALLQRWHSEQTALLDRGHDRRTSLETSIRLSLASPRLARAPHAHTLLGVLALLPDGAPRDALPALAPHLPTAHAGAAAAALLQTALAHEDGAGRLRVLAPVRAFVLRHHRPPRAHAAALERYAWDVARLAARIDHAGGADAIRLVAGELRNVEAVAERALRDDFDPTHAIRAVVDLARFYKYTSLGSRHLLREATALAEKIGKKELEADCLFMSGFMSHQFLGDGQPSGESVLHALELYREADNKTGQADCLEQLACLDAYYHRVDDCIKKATDAYELYVQAEHLPGQAKTLVLLGRMAVRCGDHRKATSLGKQALETVRSKIGNLPLEPFCLQFLGEVYTERAAYKCARAFSYDAIRLLEALNLECTPYHMHAVSCVADVARLCSDPSEARAQYTKALATYRLLRKPDREAYCLLNLACVALALGDAECGAEHARASLRIWRDKLHNSWGEGTCLRALGDVAMLLRNYHEAARQYLQARMIFRRVSWHADEAECHMKLGDVLLTTQKAESARTRYVTAFVQYRKVQQLPGQAHCLRRFGDISLANGEYDDATALFKTALFLYRQMGLSHGEADCILKLGDTQLALGNQSGASSHWLQAMNLYEKHQDQLRSDVCRNRLRDLREYSGSNGPG